MMPQLDSWVVRKLPTSDVARTMMNGILRAGDALGFSLVGEWVAL